jgi:hypothetical protein
VWRKHCKISVRLLILLHKRKLRKELIKFLLLSFRFNFRMFRCCLWKHKFTYNATELFRMLLLTPLFFLFDHINFGKVESRTSWWVTQKTQIKLATKFNKKDQQQGAKDNAELQTKRTMATWKTFEELFDEAETDLLRPNSWMMMMIFCTRCVAKNTLAFILKYRIVWR